MVPGDSFGARVLLPDEEIAKRIKPAPEDVQRYQMNEAFTRRLSEIQKQPSVEPVFNKSVAALYANSVSNLKASALSIVRNYI